MNNKMIITINDYVQKNLSKNLCEAQTIDYEIYKGTHNNR